MDLNKAMIIGRLTQAPELKATPSGQQVCKFSVATNFVWTNAQGQKQERVEYHNIVAWRRLAEICAQYLVKGKKVYIEGRLQTSSWQDQNGTTKYRTEIIAENMIMLDSAGGAGQKTPQAKNQVNTQQNTGVDAVMNSFNQQNSNKTDNNKTEEIRIEDIPF